MISTEHRKVIDSAPKELFISGSWVPAGNGARFPVEDPGSAEPLCDVANADADDARRALDAAATAQSTWGTHPPRERAEILRRTFEMLTARADDLALLMTLEMGKSLAESRAEVLYAAEFFRWFAEEPVRIHGRWTVSPSGGERLMTMKQPVGPCLLVTPWNFPLAMGARKIAPAVAAGCSIVCKPAQLTPLSMLALGDIMTEAGLPAGVLNIVTSTSAGQTVGAVMSDPRLRKVSFTGSTTVGKKLMEQASEQVLRISLELGGNAPFLVFDDADLDAAIDGAVIAKLRNNGESCVAANRFLVSERVADEFASRLADRLGGMRVGHGTEPDTQVGPLISEDQRGSVRELVEDALSRGAKALVGGQAGDGAGYFYPPTVLSEVPDHARLLREEIFGPVAPVTTFSSDDEALAKANDTEYGLVAYVYTRDFDRALRITEGLETGMVGLNRGLVSNPAAPFGGVKQSGIGREGGPEGIEEYLSTKYVGIQA